MAQNDTTPVSSLLADVFSALALLTRLPLPAHRFSGARAGWAWPLVGLLIGALSVLLLLAGLWLGLSPMLAAGLVVFAQTMLTGAMHEDGLADCADGFWGGATPARRLEIMKDSAIGSYGTLALIIGVGLRVMAIAALADAHQTVLVLLFIPMLSRAPMVILMRVLPNARGAGLAASTGVPPRLSVAVALGGPALLAFLFLPIGLAVMLLVALAVAALACGIQMHRKIGGQTGDTLGATQQVTEITLLLVASCA